MPTYATPDYRWPQSGESVRVGATKPPMRVNVQDKSGPVDYSDAGLTVTFASWGIAGGSVSVNEQSATHANGYLEYQWQSGDTNTAGDYRGRFKVVWGDGRVSFVPVGKFIVYTVRADDGS